MNYISGEDIASVFSYEAFIPVLRKAFCGTYNVPPRQHHEFENGMGENTSTLLIMPAWSNGQYVGIKTVTVSPYNSQLGLPAIQGIYTLIDAQNGLIKTQMDAKVLTVKRTAATSALASKFLSRSDSDTLLMIGTGALAPELIQAHCTVRPIKKVIVWGRNTEKARELKNQLSNQVADIEVVTSLEQAVKKAHIISIATLSREPLVLGKWLKPGQHLDLVGAYRPDMREADDEVLKRASIFIDHEGALKESGDLYVPLQKGSITEGDIKSDLKALSQENKEARSDKKEITLFKSVGHALEDLSAALFVLEKMNDK